MNQRVLITGASAGAGRAMAEKFASEQFDLTLIARRSDLLEEARQEISDKYGVDVVCLPGDLASQETVLALYRQASEIGMDVLINNAGVGDWNFVWDVSLDKFNQMIDLNARALAMLSTLFVRDNKDRDACLINVTSLAGYALFGAAVPYSATKFFATAFTEGLIHDLKAVGSPMRAKVMTPGPIDTEFTAISLAETRLEGMDASGVEFHTPRQIAEFTWALYQSDKPVGRVDLDTMSFVLGDTMHPSGAL